MTRFRKLRELLTLARRLEREAAKMSSRGQGYWDRRSLADECRAKAEWLAGRLTDEEYNTRLCDAADVRTFPV